MSVLNPTLPNGTLFIWNLWNLCMDCLSLLKHPSLLKVWRNLWNFPIQKKNPKFLYKVIQGLFQEFVLYKFYQKFSNKFLRGPLQTYLQELFRIFFSRIPFSMARNLARDYFWKSCRFFSKPFRVSFGNFSRHVIRYTCIPSGSSNNSFRNSSSGFFSENLNKSQKKFMLQQQEENWKKNLWETPWEELLEDYDKFSRRVWRALGAFRLASSSFSLVHTHWCL